jgi:hypothetical protein
MHNLSRQGEKIMYFNNFYENEWNKVFRFSKLIKDLSYWENKNGKKKIVQESTNLKFKVIQVRSLMLNIRLISVQAFNHLNQAQIKSSSIMIKRDLSD